MLTKQFNPPIMLRVNVTFEFLKVMGNISFLEYVSLFVVYSMVFNSVYV